MALCHAGVLNQEHGHALSSQSIVRHDEPSREGHYTLNHGTQVLQQAPLLQASYLQHSAPLVQHITPVHHAPLVQHVAPVAIGRAEHEEDHVSVTRN